MPRTSPEPLRIGITGGIGSGKSTVCRLFALHGIAVYDCDARAKELMNANPALIGSIIALLGPAAYRDGTLDRAYVASRVFSDRALLDRLDGLVHPALGDDFRQWASRQKGPYIIMESAILFESGFEKHVDRTVAVTAPVEVRIGRVVARDGGDAQAVRRRIANQMDDAQRTGLADYTIDNDGQHSLVDQVATLHNIFNDEGK